MAQSLKSQISEDLRQALKKRNQPVVSTLRMFLAALKNEEIKKHHQELSDKAIQVLLQREKKKIKESIEAFKLGERDDLVAKETASLEILQRYLPAQLPAEEIEIEVKKIIKEFSAGPKDFGRVMGEAMKRLQGRAEGQIVNQIVKKLLSK